MNEQRSTGTHGGASESACKMPLGLFFELELMQSDRVFSEGETADFLSEVGRFLVALTRRIRIASTNPTKNSCLAPPASLPSSATTLRASR